MIDWPNLIGGFILGIATSAAFWLLDRARERRKEKHQALSDWMSAASNIELLLWKPDTTAATIYAATAVLPLDRWRRLLGPEDFQALDRVQALSAATQALSVNAANNEETMARFAQASIDLGDAKVTFANRVRFRKADAYNRVMGRENQRTIRVDFYRHPIRTYKRERHNRKVRRESAPAPRERR